jgi:hypothetical protein
MGAALRSWHLASGIDASAIGKPAFDGDMATIREFDVDDVATVDGISTRVF